VWSNPFIWIEALVKPWTNKQQPHTRMEYAAEGHKEPYKGDDCDAYPRPNEIYQISIQG
jgi:hypothetical protein